VLKGQATTKFTEFHLLFPSPLFGTDHPTTHDHPATLDGTNALVGIWFRIKSINLELHPAVDRV
jgi:hypothetical protein